MSDYAKWMKRAGLDIKDASLILESRKISFSKNNRKLDEMTIYYNNVFSLCQQAVEKSLKACYLLKSKTLIKGHNISYLLNLLRPYDIKFDDFFIKFKPFQHAYIEYRYVEDDGKEFESSYYDAKEFYDLTREIYEFSLAFIKDAKNSGKVSREVAITKMNTFGGK